MNRRENILKAIRFEKPDYIPMAFHINEACWHHYDQEALKDLMETHTYLFPGYKRVEGEVKPHYGLDARKDEPYTDPWGCVWSTSEDGISGSVQGHPLETWGCFADYRAPLAEKTDGMFPVNWEKIKADVQEAKGNDSIVMGGLPHGHTFLRLQDIRGYINLIFDMTDENQNLVDLIEMISNFNYQVISRWITLEPDVLWYPDDLGMQIGPMISPDHFRRYIKPVYQRLMQPARENGIIAHMHSDGDIRLLVDDIIDCGVDVINLQDLVNGIDWIAKKFAGRICIDLDIDRQQVTLHGTTQQIDNSIREKVEKLGNKRGGLMMIYGLYPGVPLENVKALMDAMEKYAIYYS